MSYRLAEIDLEDSLFEQEHIATITLNRAPWQVLWLKGDLPNGRGGIVDIADMGKPVIRIYLDDDLCQMITDGFFRPGDEYKAVLSDVIGHLISDKRFAQGGELWFKNSYHTREAGE